MDHGEHFGWQQLSMCKDFVVSADVELGKSQRRKGAEEVRRKWKKERVEWARCAVVDWGEDIERLVQRHISRGPIIASSATVHLLPGS